MRPSPRKVPHHQASPTTIRCPAAVEKDSVRTFHGNGTTTTTTTTNSHNEAARGKERLKSCLPATPP